MKPMQKMVAPDGREICLFPLAYMRVTQGEGGSYSHENTYNFDFSGWGASGKVNKCPYYAPCTLRCVAIWSPVSNNRVYQSVNPVHLADGTLDYLTISFSHDDNPRWGVGDIVQQGDIIGHTGTTGEVTGDHVHTCCGKGQYRGFTYRQSTIDPTTGHYDLTNRAHYYDCCYINDTVISADGGFPWLYYGGATLLMKSKFPWVLYARKFRNKHK